MKRAQPSGQAWEVRVAEEQDRAWLESHYGHYHGGTLDRKLRERSVLLCLSEGGPVGFLGWGYLYDMFPFMNQLWLEAPCRGQGAGRALVEAWEAQMASLGFTWVMTSTQVDETAQHFYRHLGYGDIGAILLPDQPAELFMHKSLASHLVERPLQDVRLTVDESTYLSRVKEGDQQAYLDHFADQATLENLLAVPFPYTRADADEWVNRRLNDASDPEWMLAIRRTDGYLIGSIGLHHKPGPEEHAAELGYWLAKEYRGKGLMPKVLRVFSQYCFDAFGFERLEAQAFLRNVASQRALEKAGFFREGVLRRRFVKKDEVLDATMYALLRGELG